MATVEVSIHRGSVLVDEADAHLLSGRAWYARLSPSGLSYAVSKGQSLHRLITGAKTGQVVDHVNGDGLDNRRDNLRVCTHTQNMQNRRKASNSACRLKGVCVAMDSRERPYRASIEAYGERIDLGSFLTAAEAAKAYDRAALIFHGKFARTNEMLGLYKQAA